MIGTLPFDGQDRFKYIIITPNKNSNVTTNQTCFNQIHMSIIDSLMSLNFISHFPSTFKEYFTEWPLCACNYYKNSDYDISYLNESVIDDNFLNFISQLRLGILFISKNMNEDISSKILDNSSIPIVSLDPEGKSSSFYDISSESMFEIYKVFYDRISEKTKQIPNNKIPSIIKNKDTSNTLYNAPGAKYLDPLSITIDRIRGLYHTSGDGIFKIDIARPDVHAQYELMADTEINKALRTIISEKFLVLMLEFIEEGSFDSRDKAILNSIGINEDLLRKFLLNKNPEMYISMSDKINGSLETINFITNMTLCIPSVNYEFIRSYFSKDIQGKDYRNVSKEAFRLSYDMNTYYGLVEPKVFKDECDLALAFYLVGERGMENTFLSLLFVFLTLSHRDPFIRTRNVPALKIWIELKRLSGFMENNTPYSKSKDINLIISTISDIIRKQVFNKTNDLEAMINRFGDHLTIVSDLPIEWVKIGDTPLCVKKKMSRIPITPGDFLASFVQANKDAYSIDSKNVNVLVINALNDDQDKELYKYGEILNKKLNAILKDDIVKYVAVKSKVEYIQAINRIKPNVLIHFGHGAYNRWKDGSTHQMSGALIINNELLNADEINSVGNFPKIVILGACTTEVPQGPNYNIANTFLSNGCLSVIGTFVPVEADYTVDFITNLIHHLYMCLFNISSDIVSSWSDIILIVRKKMYIEEPIYSLCRDYKRGKLRAKVENFHPIQKYINFCKENGISIETSLEKRNMIYEEIFKTEPELHESFKNISSLNTIVPYISFFTSLGSPEKIQIIRDKQMES